MRTRGGLLVAVLAVCTVLVVAQWSLARPIPSAPMPYSTGAAAPFALEAAAAVTSPGAFVPLAPTRILDTRTGNGANGPVAANGSVAVQITGRGGVPPSGVAAIVVNVTVTQPTQAGYLTVYPDGQALPTASNLNFRAGQDIPNLVIVRLSGAGKIKLTNSSAGTTHVIGDVAGYYLSGAATEPGTFTALTPARVLDTRTGTNADGPVPAGGTIAAQITGRGGVPSTGVSSVVLNVTVTQPTAFGFITVYPDGSALPDASNLNFTAGLDVPNLVMVPVSEDGRIELTNSSTGTVHLIGDVAGYYLAGTPTVMGAFVPLSPIRLLDTRTGNGASGPIAPNATAVVQLAGRGTLPATGVGAVVANTTVTQPSHQGFITVYPDETSRPNASNVNFLPGQDVPNLVVVPLSAAGRADLLNSSPGSTQLIADVAGYFLSADVTAGQPTWSPTMVNPPRGQPAAVSCSAPAFCVAVDAYGAATQYDGTRWSQPTTIATNGHLNGVSCTATRVCVGVGDLGQAATYNGTTWTKRKVVPPTGTTVNLLAASCAGSTFCVAVGSSGDAYTFNGSAWSGPVPTGSGGNQTGISCPTTTWCLAADQFGAVVTMVGTEWQPPVILDPAAFLQAVSCPEAGSCTAVSVDGRAFTLANGSWTSSVVPGMGVLLSVSCVDPATCTALDRAGTAVRMIGGSWQQPVAVGPGLRWSGVSCAGEFCAAVGPSGRASLFDGIGWSPPTVIDDRRGDTGDVSCPSATFCVAVDLTGNALTFSGATWSTPTRVVPEARAGGLSDVSCTVTGLCIAVGGDESTGTSTVATYSGSVWSVGDAPVDRPVDVSCASPTFCVMIGATGGASTFDGSRWAGAVSIGSGEFLTAVSCPSQSMCVAVDQRGQLIRYDGARWSAPAIIDFTGWLTAVNCPSPTFCVAADDRGNILMSADGLGWSLPTITAIFGIQSVSCASSTWCAAATAPTDKNGYLSTFDGSSWSAPITISGINDFRAVACPSVSTCMAVDDTGLAVLGRR